MGKVITANLSEVGQNRGLFGPGSARARRRVRETGGINAPGERGAYARSADDAPPPALRPSVVRKVESAIEEADEDGHPIAGDLRDVLDKHGEDERDSRESREVRRRIALLPYSQQCRAVREARRAGRLPARTKDLRRWCQTLLG